MLVYEQNNFNDMLSFVSARNVFKCDFSLLKCIFYNWMQP